MSDKSVVLTVLTDPVPVGRYFFGEYMRKILRPIRYWLRPPPVWIADRVYRGHYAVTKSLVTGLDKLGVSFNYNPKQLKNIGETVVVLAGLRTLRQAIELKKRGYIKRLIAGPNILVWPSQHPEIAYPEVDICIIPSEWTCVAFEQNLPALKGRCIIWPAGVNTDYWKPTELTNNSRKGIVIYIKDMFDGLVLPEQYVRIFNKLNIDIKNIHMIIRGPNSYYTPEEYRHVLDKSQCLIGFTRSESQGIAWAEAWAMDVPTFILWNDKCTIEGSTVPVSTAPYLSASTGCFFKDEAELERLLLEMPDFRTSFLPRDWVIKNMSDEVCAARMLTLVSQC